MARIGSSEKMQLAWILSPPMANPIQSKLLRLDLRQGSAPPTPAFGRERVRLDGPCAQVHVKWECWTDSVFPCMSATSPSTMW